MVMVEDERRRDNRLTMLSAIASMYLCIADFSKIVIEGA
jgi:glycyl-tRNA synthetase beta subunit